MHEILELSKKVFSYFNKKDKIEFYRLQFLVFFMSICELASVAIIVPFMAVASDPSKIYTNNFLSKIFDLSGLEEWSFLLFLGLSIIFFLFLSMLNSINTNWLLFKFSSYINSKIVSQLYESHINQDWLFHTRNKSSESIHLIISESKRLGDYVITPLFILLTKLIFTTILFTAAIIYDPLISSAGILIFTLSYILIFFKAKSSLNLNDLTILKADLNRNSIIANSLNGVKDLIFYGKQSFYSKIVLNANNEFASSKSMNLTIGAAPRYFVEFILFSSVVGLIVFLLNQNQNDFNAAIPQLSAFFIISVKLLPAFQTIYSTFVQIKGNISSYRIIEKTLKTHITNEGKNISKKIGFKHNIIFENINFKYPNTKNYVLSDLNFEIKKDSMVGIVGMSGSGKSTIIDILTGMIKPSTGYVKLDGEKLSDINVYSFRKKIGLVHQNSFLMDGTIKENIIFGFDDFDKNKINQAVSNAGLSDFIKSLPDGLNTKIGNNAVQLSGGQKQRISIARALYGTKNIIIFDEATSALDGIVENEILENFSSMKDKTRIIISHKLTNLKNCDSINIISNGKIIQSGTYDELKLNEPQFKKLA